MLHITLITHDIQVEDKRHIEAMRHNIDESDRDFNGPSRNSEIDKKYTRESSLKYDATETDYAKKLDYRCEGILLILQYSHNN